MKALRLALVALTFCTAAVVSVSAAAQPNFVFIITDDVSPDDLGIYGNCVVIDHGLGIASLYGHLSQIGVAVGDDVTKGQPLGLSGETGLAGGDHLHFAFLVGQTYVDPLEWWDQKWVRSHVDVRLERSDP